MNTATLDDIKSGKTADVYFERTRQVLSERSIHKRVSAEVRASALPNGYQWAVLAGLDEVAEILEGVAADVWAMPEGTLFRTGQPVLRIEGDYLDFGRLETAVLGCLCQASGIATKASRCKKAAGERPVLSFGARRMHPAIAPMIERSAYVGGCDGVSVVLSAERLGIRPSGTMPHALVLILGDIVEACKLFDEVIPSDVQRVALVDTFCDEKTEAIRAAETLGDRLSAVRLDTPGSRRGDLRAIAEEVRWELDLRGYQHVGIFVSGGLDEEAILRLNPLVNGYGVGTAIAGARVIDLAMDIVAIEGKPVAKRGKMSGVKQVMRCRDCLADRVVPNGVEMSECDCGGRFEALLAPLIREGELACRLAGPQEVRDYVLRQLGRFETDI